MPLICEVIIDISHYELDKVFSYLLPENYQASEVLGAQVLVPFGPQKQRGFVVNVTDKEVKNDLKSIAEILTPPLLDKKQLYFVKWLRNNYFCLYINGIKTILPPEIIKNKSNYISGVKLTHRLEELKKLLSLSPTAPKQELMIEIIAQKGGEMSLTALKKEANYSARVLKALQAKGLVEKTAKIEYHTPLNAIKAQSIKSFNLNLEHNLIIKKLKKANQPQLYFSPLKEKLFLIYFELIKDVLERGKSVLLILPEYSLLKKTAAIFKTYFSDYLILYAGNLKSKEKFSQWWQIKNSTNSLILSLKSGIFASHNNLDLIIVHDEANSSYQPLSTPKYNLNKACELLAKLHQARLILVSSNPTLESYYHHLSGRYQLIRGLKGGTENLIPHKTVIDMRYEFSQGNISIFSNDLILKMKQLYQAQEKILLFVNYKGFAPFVLCRSCGFIKKCPHCSLSMTYQKDKNRFYCSFCRSKEEKLAECPHCQSTFFRPFGLGIDRVVEELKKLFNKPKLVAIDGDKVKNEAALDQIMQKLKQNKGQFVVGTRMALKEIFPSYKLIAVLSADLIFNLPFYASAEEGVNLLNTCLQKASIGGEVLIQTYQPQHDVIKLGFLNNYETFAAKELKRRRATKNPPYYHLLSIMLSAPSKTDLVRQSLILTQNIKKQLSPKIEVLGPAAPFFPRLKDNYRMQISCRSSEFRELKALYKKIKVFIGELGDKGLRVSLDINPRKML